MARILIVDDNDYLRKVIRNLLETQEGWEVCGEAVNGKEGVSQATLLQPEVVVIDIQMPVMNGFEATREILGAIPQTRVLILSIENSSQHAQSAAACGAHGFLSKAQASRELIPAISTLLQNESYFQSGSPR